MVFVNFQKFDKSKSKDLIDFNSKFDEYIINHITSKSNDIPIVSTDKRLHNFLSNYNNFGRFFA